MDQSAQQAPQQWTPEPEPVDALQQHVDAPERHLPHYGIDAPYVDQGQGQGQGQGQAFPSQASVPDFAQAYQQGAPAGQQQVPQQPVPQQQMPQQPMMQQPLMPQPSASQPFSSAAPYQQQFQPQVAQPYDAVPSQPFQGQQSQQMAQPFSQQQYAGQPPQVPPAPQMPPQQLFQSLPSPGPQVSPPPQMPPQPFPGQQFQAPQFPQQPQQPQFPQQPQQPQFPQQPQQPYPGQQQPQFQQSPQFPQQSAYPQAGAAPAQAPHPQPGQQPYVPPFGQSAASFQPPAAAAPQAPQIPHQFSPSSSQSSPQLPLSDSQQQPHLPPQGQAGPPVSFPPPPNPPKVRDAFLNGAAPFLQPGEQVYYGFILKLDSTIEETPEDLKIAIEGQHNVLGDIHRASGKMNRGMKWAADPLGSLGEKLTDQANEAMFRHLAGPVFTGGWTSQAGWFIRYVRATSEDYGPGAYGAVTSQRYLVFRGARLGGAAMRVVYGVPRTAIAGVRIEGGKDALKHARTPRAELHFTDGSMVATMMPGKQGEQLAAVLQPPTY
jgi:hypothetical protein